MYLFIISVAFIVYSMRYVAFFINHMVLYFSLLLMMLYIVLFVFSGFILS